MQRIEIGIDRDNYLTLINWYLWDDIDRELIKSVEILSRGNVRKVKIAFFKRRGYDKFGIKVKGKNYFFYSNGELKKELKFSNMCELKGVFELASNKNEEGALIKFDMKNPIVNYLDRDNIDYKTRQERIEDELRFIVPTSLFSLETAFNTISYADFSKKTDLMNVVYMYIALANEGLLRGAKEEELINSKLEFSGYKRDAKLRDNEICITDVFYETINRYKSKKKRQSLCIDNLLELFYKISNNEVEEKDISNMIEFAYEIIITFFKL